VHGESQQTPSTQKLESHSLLAEQPLPFVSFGTQKPPEQ
jgi:hypothetical protein